MVKAAEGNCCLYCKKDSCKQEKNEKEIWIRQKTISKEGREHMKDVNVTYEFFDDYRELIVSKKVEQIILHK